MTDDRRQHRGYRDLDDEAGAWMGRIIVMLWLFCSGAALGWIAHRWIG